LTVANFDESDRGAASCPGKPCSRPYPASRTSQSARQIDFLEAKNRSLKKQITGRPKLRDVERRQLAELGKPLGRKTLAEISTIVTPDTTLRWNRQLIARKLDGSASRRRTGRPPTPEEIRELVLR